MPFPPKEKSVSPRTPERQDWKRIIDEKEKRERDELEAKFKDNKQSISTVGTYWSDYDDYRNKGL